jgi:hypothetical protein
MKFVLHKYINIIKHAKKLPTNLLISISLTSNEMYKNIVPSKQKDHTLYFQNLGIQIYNINFNMGLGKKN